MKNNTVRIINLFSFAVCCSLLGFAYYMEMALNLQPCPLCVLERIIFALLGIFFLMAAYHNPGNRGQKIYGSITLLLALFGMLFAGRHLWLQGRPNALSGMCVPGINYLLKTFPLSKAFETIFMGSSDCTKVSWTFLGLTIPGWTFLFYDFFALLGLGFIKGIFNRYMPPKRKVFHTQ